MSNLDNYDGDLWQDWQQLAEKAHNNNPMLHHLFVQKIAKYFPANIFVAKATNTQNDIIALMLLEPCRKGKWRIFKPSQAQAALVVVLAGERLQLKGLFSLLPDFVYQIDMHSLDPREHKILIEALPEHAVSIAATNITIEVQGNFDSYWEKRIKVLKKNMRRYHNRIDKEQGTLTVDIYSLVQDVSDGVDRYGMIESRGWKGKIGTALHPGNTQGAFYRELMKDFAKDKNALVIELKLGGNIVASRLCLFNQDILVILKTTYEESYKRFAVGKVLLYHLVKYIFDHKLTNTIDFYTNANRDQVDWSSEQRTMLNATLYRYKWLDALVSTIKKVRFKVRKA
ncbi:GNAT family N-acetyltransferase [Thalassotalea algicola]|uniref:GNAT family N-acetyltransferase n=1 Tax=Thalassotalea algicola TaxID=2716224 RepID=UPI00145E3E3C|nr:GNAT family N-acetyltransferase [Thalassotalea algicola]